MDKKKFFKKFSIAKSTVKVEGFGDVECHELKLADRLKVADLIKGDLTLAMATVISMGCPMFSEEDIPQLAEVKQEVLFVLFGEITKISGMKQDPEKKP